MQDLIHTVECNTWINLCKNHYDVNVANSTTKKKFKKRFKTKTFKSELPMYLTP